MILYYLKNINYKNICCEIQSQFSTKLQSSKGKLAIIFKSQINQEGYDSEISVKSNNEGNVFESLESSKVLHFDM